MRVAFFEDEDAADLHPLTLTRPLYEVICGQYSNRERVIRQLHASAWGAFLRDYLAETYRETQPEAHVNDFNWLSGGETLLVNGRWLPDVDALRQIDRADVGILDETVVYLTITPTEAAQLRAGNWVSVLRKLATTRNPVHVGGRLPRYPWDIVEHNPRQLEKDYSTLDLNNRQQEFGPQVALVGDPELLHVAPTASVEPFVVFDTRNGPVSVEAGAVIQAFTRLEGPCHISRGSRLFRANIRGGTTIGPACRVGGEIESSIFHSHANKYHDGFIGHSYICPWVNLGAETTGSDLKNDYSEVRVPLSGEMLSTGTTKVGSFIGDHTKTGLGSLFNTGSSLGVMCMVLPAGELLPKYFPSFCSFQRGQLIPSIDLEGNLRAARITMFRRDCEFSDAQERLLRFLYDESLPARERAATRFQERRAQIGITRQLRAA